MKAVGQDNKAGHRVLGVSLRTSYFLEEYANNLHDQNKEE